MFFIYTERYSDFNSLIERYEREMRRLFEEKHKDLQGEEWEKAAKTAVYKEDVPLVQQPDEKNENDESSMPHTDVKEENELKQDGRSEDKTGSIIAEVTTARGAVPLAGVTVVIDRFDPDDEKNRRQIVSVEVTNQSGRTKPVKVAAEERDLSLEPGNSDPFTTFYISAKAVGFEPVKDRPVDVFADEVSILKIDMIPKPEKLSEGRDNRW